MQHRQKHEIARDILAVCNGGALITHVMFHTCLSHAQATSYLGELLESGLIEIDPFNAKKYFSTAKGLAYMAGIESMNEMLSLHLSKAKIVA